MAPVQKKIIAIIGATGNQGGSVAQRFLQDPDWHVRGITRNISSPAAQSLKSKGAEVIAADLDDIDSLKAALPGANLIFSVTNYWEPFYRPDCRAKAEAAGISCRKYAYDVEYQQGKNIADAAAATVESLAPNGFIASTLSHASKSSKGKYKKLYHFDAKADVFPDYVSAKHPALAAKMSCLQTGYFTSSYKLAPQAYFGKQADGSFVMRFPTDPNKPVQHLDVNADTGNYVYAIAQLPPGKSYMAAGTVCSWNEYVRLWNEVTGAKGRYQQITLEQFAQASPDEPSGWEIGEMFEYSSDPGYDGGDKDLLYVEDIRKVSSSRLR